ncbi:MAG: cell division protein FtsQ [Stomatobaculum sp.]|nr:cell division protein FtsQ [Stomatobaculum sp.]
MRHKIILVLVSVFLFLAILGVSMSVSSVKVTGNRTYTAEQIEQLVFPSRISRNCVVCLVNGILGKKRKIPFVEDYKVSFTGPTEVEVIVYEKSIVGYVTYMSSRMYFDKDGIIVESASQRLPGIPEITGLHFGQIVLYKELPVENRRIFSMILNLTQTLSTFNIPADMIRYDKDLNATLNIGNVSVLLGGANDMNGKLSELSNILPRIQDLDGTLDLSDYDPTVPNRMFSFRRR